MKLDKQTFTDGRYLIENAKGESVFVMVDGENVDLDGSPYRMLVPQGSRYDEQVRDLVLDRISPKGAKCTKCAEF